jgi:hypothetical protein
LRLDCSKARSALGWQPVLALQQALEWVVDWHQAVAAGGDARDITLAQIAAYDELRFEYAGNAPATSQSREEIR